ncbi:hypothetical protein LINPERHAP2_LOCUS24583 [Linum perenne]
MVIRNCRKAMMPKTRNIARGENLIKAIPPSRLPRTPPAEDATETNDWRSLDEDDELLEEDDSSDCLDATSATIASFATSASDAPRLLRRRYRDKLRIETLDGDRRVMETQEMPCNKAAPNGSDGNVREAVLAGDVEGIGDEAVERFTDHGEIGGILEELKSGRVEIESVFEEEIDSEPWETSESLDPVSQTK